MRNHQLTTWPCFLQAIEAGFAHSPYEDPTGLLYKLTQKGIVKDYLNNFEALAKRIVGLPPSFLLSCFISGLDLDIHRKVQPLQLFSLVHSTGLTCLMEDKLHENHKGFRGRQPPGSTFASAPPGPTFASAPPGPSFAPPPSTTPFALPLLAPVPTNNPNLPLLPSLAKPPPLPVRRLIVEELANRRERGLCFNCDEKFTRGHHCAPQFFLLAADEDHTSEDTNPNISSQHNPILNDPTLLTRTDSQHNPTLTQPQTEPLLAQISLHALSGQTAPETLRLVGWISHQLVVILVGGGSTHNFVQEHLVKSLGLKAQPTPPLRMLVGNGNELECHHLCRDVKILVQGKTFMVDLHVFPLCGTDVILGVQ